MFLLFDHERILINVKDIKTIRRYICEEDNTRRISINLAEKPHIYNCDEIYETVEELDKRWNEIVEMMLKIK